MTADELRKRFPRASNEFINANITTDQGNNPRPTAIVEPDPRHAALGAVQVQDAVAERFLVRVTSVRKRLLDEDNLCVKYHVDCLRYAGLLPSDNPAKTSIQITQRKAGKGEPEHTEIEIYPQAKAGQGLVRP